MWSKNGLVIVIVCFLPFIFLAQDMPKKERFVSEKTFHIKAGCAINYINTTLFKLLNFSKTNVFTPRKNISYNPSVDLEFDTQFLKHFGINLDLGFLQTRNYYTYENTGPTPIGYSNSPKLKQNNEGLILCNIPHLNFSPSFYVSNTRFNIGMGIYKYYYTFNPLSVGNVYFDLNSEGLLLYSTAGITQSVNLKAYTFTISVNYFGFSRKYDQGFQVTLGIVL